ncbi:glycosyltransferase [Eudoraea chungangensis]|uniref:glycosyltransferase n=1 Tax=Eudoraea chungangensis TaxID=1481905 RepID=UPI0023EC1FE3|nr:glycosyltransferase [Eudoraea chungangensis]
MRKKINVVFIVPSLRPGGAERVVSYIADNIDKQLFQAHLLIIGTKDDKSYNINSVPVTFLNKKRVKNSFFSIVQFIMRNEVDVVMSTMAHLNVMTSLISLLFPQIKFVGRETIVRSGKIGYKKKKVKDQSLADKVKIHLLDAIICQSIDMKMDLVENFSYPENKTVVINNPVTKKFKLKVRQKTKNEVSFITVGRLRPQKGYFRIIDALAKFKEPFHYTIVGKGIEKDDLIDYIDQKGLSNSVSFIDFTDSVENYLAQSDIFLQGSYVEGFPNALLESCAVGTPVIAFDALGGINEIIQNGVNGYIARDEVEFVEKLKLACKQEWNPETVRSSVLDKYSEEIILSNYENFFMNLIKGKIFNLI